MVDIQQRALSPFKQDILTGFSQVVHHTDGIAHHGTQLFGHLHRRVQHFLEVDRRFTVVIHQHEVVVVEHFAQLGSETFAMQHIA